MASFTIGSGGDYSTVNEWWSALPATLTEDHIGVVLPTGTSWNGLLSTSVVFGEYKAVLRSDYSGVIGGVDMPIVETSGLIRSAGISNGALEISKLFFTGTSSFESNFSSGGPFDIYVRDCMFRNTSTTNTMVIPRPVFGPRIIENCILEHTNSGGWHIDARNSSATELRVKNCLFIQSSATPDLSVIGFDLDTRSLHSCGFFAPNGTWGRSAIFSSSSRGDYNYGDDASIAANMTGTNNVSGVVLSESDGAGSRWIVESISGGDFRSKNIAGNVALGGGDPANSTLVDMLGVVRDTTPDAGPFEFATTSSRRRSPLLLTPW